MFKQEKIISSITKNGFQTVLRSTYGLQCVGDFKKIENLYKKLSGSHNSLTFPCKCRDNKG